MVVALNDIKKNLRQISSKTQYISRFLEYGSIRNFSYNDKKNFPSYSSIFRLLFRNFVFCIHLYFTECLRRLSKFQFTNTYPLIKNADVRLKLYYAESNFIQLRPGSKGIAG